MRLQLSLQQVQLYQYDINSLYNHAYNTAGTLLVNSTSLAVGDGATTTVTSTPSSMALYLAIVQTVASWLTVSLFHESNLPYHLWESHMMPTADVYTCSIHIVFIL